MLRISSLLEPSRRWMSIPILILIISGLTAAIVLNLGSNNKPREKLANAAATPRRSSTPSPKAPAVVNPEAVVKNYVAAINTQNYAEAWAVGGKNTGVPFSAFVSDFNTTAYDHLDRKSVV